VPSAEAILSWATGVANDWHWLAISWHVALAALLIAVGRSRVSERVLALVLVLPIISVAVLAWLSWNPFNGLMFTILAALLLRSARHVPRSGVTRASPGWRLAGWALIAFGWVYPHFLIADQRVAYAYASPFGVLPCPTLAVVVGVTLVSGGFRSVSWNAMVAAAGVLYGAIGVFSLGVVLDVWLLVGAIVLGAGVTAELVVGRVRATDEERTRRLPGDDLIAAAAGTVTNAITLSGEPPVVWPWLAQMGAGSRAGWYSYDFLDNRRRPSARRIIPELQHIRVGDIFPALPGITEGFVLLAFEPDRSLTLGWLNPDGSPMVTWVFVLEAHAGNTTRLIVRVRYRPPDQPRWLPLFAIRLQHFVMQRKQLLEIAGRVKVSTAAGDEWRGHHRGMRRAS
jgi:hypothetical protein